MAERKDLPLEITQKMDGLLIRAGEASRSGNDKESIELSLEAWELMPSPKERWDFYPQVMAKNIVDDYVLTKDIEKTRKWIEITYQMYGDARHEQVYTLFVEGIALYKLDLKSEAYDVFESFISKSAQRGRIRWLTLKPLIILMLKKNCSRYDRYRRLN